MIPAEVASRWRQAMDVVIHAVDQVQVIPWCTPQDLVGLTRSLIEAAQGRRPTPDRPRYEEVPESAVLDALRLAEQRLVDLADHPLIPEITEHLHAAGAAVKAVASRDDEEFSAWSLTQYGGPDSSTLAFAAELLAADPADDEETYGAADLAALVKAALASHHLHDWRVEITTRLAKISVRAIRKTVYIRRDARFSEREAACLATHEVEGHVLRAANAFVQPDPVARIALGDSRPTEEGIAAWLERSLDSTFPNRWRIFAARALAVDLAYNAGASSIVQALQPHLGWQDSATVALRVKRGLSDPEQPGGYTKDHAYLSGLTQITAHLSQHPSDLVALMATKWPLQLLDHTRTLIDTGHLHPPTYLPRTQ